MYVYIVLLNEQKRGGSEIKIKKEKKKREIRRKGQIDLNQPGAFVPKARCGEYSINILMTYLPLFTKFLDQNSFYEKSIHLVLEICISSLFS